MLRHPHDFGGRHRPYQNIPTQHKPVDWPSIIILGVLTFAFCFLVWQCTKAIGRVEIKRTLSPVEKAEHDRLLRRHGLEGFSVVLVKDDGKFFVRDGNLNKFR